MVEGLLPQYVNRDIDVTITLLEKNLKIMADMALMKEAVTQLIKNAMDALPGSGKFSLSINRVNFEIESLLDGDDSMLGACAFISLTDNGVLPLHKGYFPQLTNYQLRFVLVYFTRKGLMLFLGCARINAKPLR